MSQDKNINFDTIDGAVPAVVQDPNSKQVLLVGFMNEEAYQKTLDTKKVILYNRTDNKLWTASKASGDSWELEDIKVDSDNNALLVYATPQGAFVGNGTDTCFEESNSSKTFFIDHLKQVIASRKQADPSSSYTSSLFHKGINKVAQKVGEEAVELVIEAKDNNKDLFLGEAADLFFHYLVLLEAKDISFDEVLGLLVKRHQKKD